MRLIDAVALKKHITEIFETEIFETEEKIDKKWAMGLKYSLKIIDKAPTVELDESVIQKVLNKRCMTAVANECLIALHVQRPQGEWKFSQGATTQGSLKCSFCNYRDYHKTNSNFCPNCGAKMKGGAE